MGSNSISPFDSYYLQNLITGTPEERADAAKSLANSDSPALRSRLVLLLENAKQEIAFHSASLLCGFGHSEAISPILARIAPGPNDSDAVFISKNTLAIRLAPLLHKLGGEVVPSLGRLLTESNSNRMRHLAVSAFITSPSPSQVPYMRILLESLSICPPFQSAGREARIPGRESGDDEFYLSNASVELLRRIGTREAVDVLVEFGARFNWGEELPFCQIPCLIFDAIRDLDGEGKLDDARLLELIDIPLPLLQNEQREAFLSREKIDVGALRGKKMAKNKRPTPTRMHRRVRASPPSGHSPPAGLHVPLPSVARDGGPSSFPNPPRAVRPSGRGIHSIAPPPRIKK